MITACDTLAPYTQIPTATIQSTYQANSAHDALWQKSGFDLVSMADNDTQNQDSSLYRVIAANKWLDDRKTNSAAIQLKLAKPQHLDELGETLLVLGGAKLSYQRKQYDLAYQAFQDFSLNSQALQKLPTHQMVTAFWIKANILESKGLAFEAAKTRIAIHDSLSVNHKQKNSGSIWQLLKAAPQEIIEAQLLKPQTENIQAWLDLNALARQAENQTETPNAQKNSYTQWLAAWPNHQASDIARSLVANLPSADGSPAQSNTPTPVASTSFAQAKKLAVLLPLSGRLAHIGSTIKKGMATAITNNNLDVQFLDTGAANSISDINALITTAESSGAEMVIGPLNKRWINQLGNTPIPVLALNNPTVEKTLNSNHVYFGLNPEHEATQAAMTASQKGLRTAIIIYPDNNLGRRLASTFDKAFTENGGTIISKAGYQKTDNINKLVETTLNNISTQQQRESAYKTQSSFGLDAVFMVSSPIDARQIRPALTFYYANRVPIYSISSIYTKTTDYSNRDLLNVCVPDTELIDEYMFSASLQDEHPNMSPFLLRLLAFGEDSIELSQNLHSASNDSSTIMRGKTGFLKLQSNNQVTRQMPWYRFSGEEILLDTDKRCSSIQ